MTNFMFVSEVVDSITKLDSSDLH